jgi:hypothetical protein
LGRYYAILPVTDHYTVDGYCQRTGAQRVEPGMSYSSGTNTDFLTIGQLRELIDTHAARGASC